MSKGKGKGPKFVKRTIVPQEHKPVKVKPGLTVDRPVPSKHVKPFKMDDGVRS